MPPIQAQALPYILDGKDIIAHAKSGSGKTAAFGIGILSALDVKKFRVQSLVLCPTRELVDQVAKELRRIARFKHNIKILILSGGDSFGKQVSSLSHQAHIIVATPGRVLKHLNKGSLELSHLKHLVLDEADRMLDMGFREEVDAIVAFAPKKRQTLFFSATYDEDVKEISAKYLGDAISVRTDDVEIKNNIKEIFYKTEDKFDALVKVLTNYNPKNVIVFANTKIKTKELAEELVKNNIDALAIHGDLEQYERNDVLVQFSNHSTPVLVATDVAARGLDVKELEMVINYDLANTIEIYTHRIGRTARAGAEGIAISIYQDMDDEKLEDYKELNIEFKDAKTLKNIKNFDIKPKNITLVIEGGKKDKVRAGDILGALTKDAEIASKYIGKIDIYDRQSYVAIDREFIDIAHKKLNNGKIKGKKFTTWIL
jgi:ATP-independent RNA helicase DbpA